MHATVHRWCGTEPPNSSSAAQGMHCCTHGHMDSIACSLHKCFVDHLACRRHPRQPGTPWHSTGGWPAAAAQGTRHARGGREGVGSIYGISIYIYLYIRHAGDAACRALPPSPSRRPPRGCGQLLKQTASETSENPLFCSLFAPQFISCHYLVWTVRISIMVLVLVLVWVLVLPTSHFLCTALPALS